MKKLFCLFLLGLILIGLPGCNGPDTDVAVDSTAYLRVAEILREMDGDKAANEFLATADPRLIFLIEDSIKIQGSVEMLINGQTIYEGPNTMLVGMGSNFAQALRSSICGVVSGMTAEMFIPPSSWVEMPLSVPARTAGGQGATDDLTVQSTYTAVGSTRYFSGKFWLYVGVKQIATQIDTPFNLPAGDVLTVNWTIKVPVAQCPYENAIRFDMAKGINPEAAQGGSIYNLNQGQFVFDAGNSGLLPVFQYTGGDGTTQSLLLEVRYVHSGADRVCKEFEVYNSNDDLATEKTGYGIGISADDILRGFHRVIFMGQ